MKRLCVMVGVAAAALVLFPAAGYRAEDGTAGQDFAPLFNGRNLDGWVLPPGDRGHWRVVDGCIDYDGLSEAPGDKHLWTRDAYQDFVLRLDWRIKDTPYLNTRIPIIKTDGTPKRDARGQAIFATLPDADSGVLLRGQEKAQVNIGCWPIGSGEIYGYRIDAGQPAPVRAAATPRVNADRDVGEWNTFEITMRAERVTVVLNGTPVIREAHLPGVRRSGRIGLQHHGSLARGQWSSAPALVQFRNIEIRPVEN
jgi:hypothetical protein